MFCINKLKQLNILTCCKIFNANAVEAINSCCNGSTRLLNTILEKSLMMGYQKGLKVIDND